MDCVVKLLCSRTSLSPGNPPLYTLDTCSERLLHIALNRGLHVIGKVFVCLINTQSFSGYGKSQGIERCSSPPKALQGTCHEDINDDDNAENASNYSHWKEIASDASDDFIITTDTCIRSDATVSGTGSCCSTLRLSP